MRPPHAQVGPEMAGVTCAGRAGDLRAGFSWLVLRVDAETPRLPGGSRRREAVLGFSGPPNLPRALGKGDLRKGGSANVRVSSDPPLRLQHQAHRLPVCV